MKEYTAVVVNVKDNLRLGRKQIRIPDIHGGKFLVDETGFTAPYIANADLPWAMVKEIAGLNPNVAGHNTSYDAGQIVKVVFTDQESDDIPGQFPVITDTAPKSDANKSPTVVNPNTANPSIVTQVPDTSGTSYRLPGVNPCGSNDVPDGVTLPNKTIGRADGKCGQQSKINSAFSENLADFLYAVQNTNGKIGTALVDKYTGELATSLNYVQKYTGAILGIFRDGISWIKAIITKYAAQAIDKLVKAIMTPIKGVLDPIQKVLEDVLNKVGCTLGDLEGTLANALEALLNSLIDNALDAAFGCLNTLVDGFLNEILSTVADLCNLVFTSISSITSLVSDFGDLAGEAINAVLSYLGIKCGGAGSCTATGQQSFTTKLFSNDGYGVPFSAFDTGLNAITGVSQGILTGANGLNALTQQTQQLQQGQQLGVPSYSTFAGQPVSNPALSQAITAAQSLLPTGDLFSWCTSVAETQPTFAAVVGSPITTYDTQYSIYNGAPVATGGTLTFTIYRNNSSSAGVINVLGYKASNDNVRLSGGGITGDVNNTGSFTGSDFVADSSLPSANTVFFYQKVTFAVGETQKTVTVATNTNQPINDVTGQVTFSMGVYRAADDVNLDSTYPGTHDKSASSYLNTCKGTITFTLPTTPVNVTSGSTSTPSVFVAISGISATPSGSANNCIPDILITSQPPPTYTAVNNDVVSVGVTAKPTVAGYTLTYQWQSSYNYTSGYTNVDATSPGNIITKNTTVSSVTQVWGPVLSGTTTTGSGYVFSGYTNQVTLTGITQTYSGAATSVLTISPISIFVNNNQYYRVVVTSTPSGLPTKTTYPFQVIVVASGINQYPTTTSGNVISNSGSTGAGTTTASSVYCTPYVYPVSSGVIIVTSGTTISGTTTGTTASGTNTGGIGQPVPTPIIGIPVSGNTQGPWIVPVIVGDDGSVVSIDVPNYIPPLKSEPIISISGPGAGATARAILDDYGKIKLIAVKSGGFGYKPNNTKKLCPILSDIVISAPGYYYATPPTVYINGDSSIAVADIDPKTTVVTGIRIVNPQGKVYSKPPRIEIVGGEGIGARALAVIKYVDCNKILQEYDTVVNSYKSSTRTPVQVIDCP